MRCCKGSALRKADIFIGVRLIPQEVQNTASRNFFNLLEGYIHTLQSFGIELIREQKFGKNLSRNAIADNSVDKVITESIARGLVKKSEDVIYLRKGTILTPSAKDISQIHKKPWNLLIRRYAL